MNDDQVTTLRETVRDATGDPEVECDGLRVSAGADGYTFETPETTHEALDEDEFDRVAAENPWYVSNWSYWHSIEDATRRAYLRWIERASGDDEARARDDDHDENRGVRERYEALADGISRSWGQLRITATVAEDGDRRYGLRHVADADVAFDDLETHRDPLDAREIATLDADGQYRPLATAPTLPRGWVFTDLDGNDLLRAVDAFYPATVANWHREREGALDVTHYRETAARQTGIYEVIDDLPREALDWLAEACCVDSQCLKRREWDASADDELAVPRGDGEFPCREPCSLVIAAARKWAILETEDTRTYELELTPSEKGQLEELIDATAAGRTDEIREADVNDGANRYRARYLRAKRTDEDGRLDKADGGGDE